MNASTLKFLNASVHANASPNVKQTDFVTMEDLDPLSNCLDICYSVNSLFTRMTGYIASHGMYEITPAHQPLSPLLFNNELVPLASSRHHSHSLRPPELFEEVFLTKMGFSNIRKYWCWLKLQYSFRYPNISFLCKLRLTIIIKVCSSDPKP